MYTFRFGWIPLGTADFWTEKHPDSLYMKCTVQGDGILSLVNPLDACMESWLNEDFQPVFTYRDFAFGNSLDVRWNWFEFDDSVRIKAFIEDINTHRHHEFDTGIPIHDLLGTIYYLRNTPFSGDSTVTRVFYSNDVYKIKVMKRGEELISFTASTAKAEKYEIQVLDSEYFSSGKKITVFTSPDRRKVPYLIIVEMLLGNFEFNLESIGNE